LRKNKQRAGFPLGVGSPDGTSDEAHQSSLSDSQLIEAHGAKLRQDPKALLVSKREKQPTEDRYQLARILRNR
jgi:hypothetical protein